MAPMFPVVSNFEQKFFWSWETTVLGRLSLWRKTFCNFNSIHLPFNVLLVFNLKFWEPHQTLGAIQWCAFLPFAFFVKSTLSCYSFRPLFIIWKENQSGVSFLRLLANCPSIMEEYPGCEFENFHHQIAANLSQNATEGKRFPKRTKFGFFEKKDGFCETKWIFPKWLKAANFV